MRFVRRKLFASRTRRPRAKLAELEVYPDYRKKALDNADDVIHGTLRDEHIPIRSTGLRNPAALICQDAPVTQFRSAIFRSV